MRLVDLPQSFHLGKKKSFYQEQWKIFILVRDHFQKPEKKSHSRRSSKMAALQVTITGSNPRPQIESSGPRARNPSRNAVANNDLLRELCV